MTQGGPESADRPARWVWLLWILGFLGLFLALTLATFRLLAFGGVSFGEGLEARSVVPMVVTAVVASWVLQVKVSRRRFTSLGLPSGSPAIRQLLVGASLGIALIGTVVLVLAGAGWVSWTATSTPGSPVAAGLSLAGLLLGAAFVEELLFRGYPFQVVEARFGSATALVGTSIAFGAVHLGNPDIGVLPLINITLAGLLLGVAYLRTRSLWFATGVHLGWNLVMGLSELSVSGIEFEMPGVELTLTGPEIWTGGAFGPEGGLLVSAVSIIGATWLWRWSPQDESLSRRTVWPRRGPG